MANPFTPTPVYRGGKLIGVEDPVKRQSRLPTPAEKLVYGRGGSSRGGSSRGRSSYTPPPVYTSNLLNQSFSSEAARQQAEAQFRQRQQAQQRAEQARETQRQVVISSARSSSGSLGASGSVRVDGSYYAGSAVVPGKGITADQYRRQIERRAIAEKLVEQKDVKRATFKLSDQPQDQPTPSRSFSGTGRILLTAEEAGMESKDNSVYFVKSEDLENKPYIPILTPTSMFVSKKISQVKQSRAGKFASFVLNPLGKEYKTVGGRVIPSSQFENIPPEQQRLITFSQPETILLSARFPSIKDVGVKFSGVETETAGDLQKTFLKFKTSTGERGGAVGVTEITGSSGDKIVSATDVVGYKGRGVVDMTSRESISQLAKAQTPKIITGDIQKFGVKEASITIPKGDSFYQLSAGKTGVVGKEGLKDFVSADFGNVKDGTSTIFGKTIIQGGRGDIYSFGQIKDLSNINRAGSGVNFITGSSKTVSSSQSVAATQSAVRAAVGGTKFFPATSTGVVISPISLTQVNQQQVTSSSSLQLPQQAQIRQSISPQKIDAVISPRVLSRVSTKSAVTPLLSQRVSQQPMQKTEQALRLNTNQLNNIMQTQAQTQRQNLRQSTALKSSGIFFTPITIPTIPKSPPSFPYLPKGTGKVSKSRLGKFVVLGRRFGKFKTVGVSKTEKEAFSFGKKWASKTLGVTFKVEGAKGRKLPGYRTKKTKEGILYIEPRKRRLKKVGLSKEVAEIMSFKRLKGGKKK